MEREKRPNNNAFLELVRTASSDELESQSYEKNKQIWNYERRIICFGLLTKLYSICCYYNILIVYLYLVFPSIMFLRRINRAPYTKM